MKVLLATPAYNGLVTTSYVKSLIHTINGFRLHKIDYEHLTVNDSLISRARNDCADYAISRSFDKLLFIDSDIEWEYWQVKSLLDSEKLVIGGVYPLKKFPISANFNTLNQDSHYFQELKSPKELEIFKQEKANNHGEIEVAHVATGFLSIDVSVFKTLLPKVQHYYSKDILTNELKLKGNYFDYNVKNNILESEDWGFCSLCRENGISVYINAEILLKHIGNFTYSLEN